MKQNLIDKIKETAKELVTSVRRFGDGKIHGVPDIPNVPPMPKEKHIAGEQETPGELNDYHFQ